MIAYKIAFNTADGALIKAYVAYTNLKVKFEVMVCKNLILDCIFNEACTQLRRYTFYILSFSIREKLPHSIVNINIFRSIRQTETKNSHIKI